MYDLHLKVKGHQYSLELYAVYIFHKFTSVKPLKVIAENDIRLKCEA